MTELELLAPAKNLECGIAAIDHGADAVYIGASRFGARAAVGNSIDDIRLLCEHAHLYGAKVYVTVNTIVYDEEIEDTRLLLRQLEQIKVDAILVQDMAVVELCIEEGIHIPLHSSTQMDNRTAEKVKWLKSQGFSRAVLARELSASEVASIHSKVPDMPLEVFVHGALCVSYSGICYASQYCFKRSANRGECAQFCRMKFDLVDSNNRVIEHERYLLSLKDLNQIDNLERLVLSGAVSFKIEGRLKDVYYVKNVTAAYSTQLNKIIAKYSDKYCRASRGNVKYTFQPNLQKTFNRGYTSYFVGGRQADIASFDTPKAMGEYVGKVKEIRGNSFTVAGTSIFTNGDGLCFVNTNRELEGFRVNKVINNRLFPLQMPENLRPGTVLYRNNDQEFERILSKSSAERKINIRMVLGIVPDGFSLTIDGITVAIAAEHQEAKTPQHENIVRQLTKLGSTIYACDDIRMPSDFNYFIPSSLLAELRRKAIDALMQRAINERQQRTSVLENHQISKPYGITPTPYYKKFPYLYNISNEVAQAYYERIGMHHTAPSFEQMPVTSPVIMQCRHCIRYSLGYCVKHGGNRPQWKEPLYLQLADKRRFKLEFDCNNCQMNIYAAD